MFYGGTTGVSKGQVDNLVKSFNEKFLTRYIFKELFFYAYYMLTEEKGLSMKITERPFKSGAQEQN